MGSVYIMYNNQYPTTQRAPYTSTVDNKNGHASSAAAPHSQSAQITD